MRQGAERVPAGETGVASGPDRVASPSLSASARVAARAATGVATAGGHPALASAPPPAPRDKRRGADGEPETTPDGNSGGLDRAFGDVRVSITIDDADRLRAERTRRLVSALASQLGLPADGIHIRVDGAAGARVRAHQARGLMADGVIHLPPTSFDPTSAAGARVLAHEVVHLAQRRLPAASTPAAVDAPTRAAAVTVAAEAEARAIAGTFVAARHAPAPRVALPWNAVAADAENGDTADALAVSVSKSHGPEIARIIDLLSYGPFDWAVTDGDVADVIEILAMSPMLVARAMARDIGTKYRRRFVDNLSPEHYDHRTELLAVFWAAEPASARPPAEWKGLEDNLLVPLDLHELDPLETMALAYVWDNMSDAGRQASLKDEKRAARIQEARLKAPDAASAYADSLKKANADEQAAKAARELPPDEDVKKLLPQIIAKVDAGLNKTKALALLDDIGKTCFAAADPSKRFRELANAIQDERVDKIVKAVPVKEGLYARGKRRNTFVYLLATRSPFKNAELAHDLLSLGLFDWAVTSEEAFLAYLIVKSMPPQAREGFMAGKRWKTILKELPPSILESDGFNLYSGGAEQKDRQTILLQLADPDIWSAGKKDKLDAVLRMAEAADEGAYVFEQSRREEAYLPAKGLGDLVEKYRLYDPTARPPREKFEAVEAKLEGYGILDEGPFAILGSILAGLDFILKSDNVDLDTLSLGGEGLNLGELQDATGGSFLGARFARPTKDDRAAARKAGKEKKPDTLPANFANLRWNLERGALELFANELAIERIAYPFGEKKFASGKSTLHGMKLGMQYMPKARLLRSMHLDIASIQLADIAIVFPDSMLSINKLELTNLSVIFEAADKAHLDSFKLGGEGLGMVFSNLWNVIMGSASSDLADSFTNPGWPMEMRLSFDGLVLSGLATSSGSFIQKVEIAGVLLHGGGTRTSYLAGLEESALRIRASIKTEREAANATLGDTEKARHADALARLEAQLARVTAEIGGGPSAGSTLDIAGVKVTGIEGLTSKPVTLDNIHGQGRSVSGVLPFLTNSTALRNLIVGEEMVPTIKGKNARPETFDIDVGRIEAHDVKLPGAIPTGAQAKQDLVDFRRAFADKRGELDYRVSVDVLADRATKAARHEELLGRGVASLEDAEARELTALRAWLTAYESARAATVGEIVTEGTAISVDAGGQLGVSAGTLSVKDVRTRRADRTDQLHITEIAGTKIDVRAVLDGGVGSLGKLREKLESASVKAESLSLRGISDAGSGATIDEVAFKAKGDQGALDASITRDPGAGHDTAVAVGSGELVVTGFKVATHEAALRAELARVEAIADDDRVPADAVRSAEIHSMLDDLDRLRLAQQTAVAAVAKAKTKAERAKAAKQRDDADQALRDWEDRLAVDELTIEHLNLRAGGLGDLLAGTGGFTKPGATFSGTGASGRLFDQATVKGARRRSATGDQVRGSVTLGPATGALMPTDTGWKATGIRLETIEASAVAYVAGAVHLATSGKTTLGGLEIDAELAESNDAYDITVDAAIATIASEGLVYGDADKTVTVKSGTLEGLHLDGLHVTIPKSAAGKLTLEGAISLERVKSLAVGATVGAYTVDAAVATDASVKAGTAARTLRVTLARSGEQTVDFAGLGANADVAKLGSDSHIHVELKHLSGEVKHSGDNISVKGLQLGTLAVGASHWAAGDKTIDIHDKVTLTGVSIDAEAKTAQRKKPKTVAVATAGKPKAATALDGAKADDTETVLDSLVFTHAAVARIDAKDVAVTITARAEDKAKGITAGARKSFELGAATIVGLELTGFDVLNTTGKAEIKNRVDVMNLRTTIGEIGKGAIKRATASITAFGKAGDSADGGHGGRELSATLLGKDGTIVRLGRIDHVDLADIIAGKIEPGTEKLLAGVKVGSTKLGEITTGDIIITDGKVQIGDINVASVDVGAVAWRSEENGATITAASATVAKGLHVENIAATFVKVPTTGKGKDSEERTLDELTIEGLSMDTVVAKTLRYDGPMESKPGAPKTTITADLPEATLSGVSLRRLSKSFSTNLLAVEGGLKSISAPNITAKLAESVGGGARTTKLFGDVSAGEITADAVLETKNAATKDEKTAIKSGSFTLSNLGLKRLSAETIDEKGNVVRKVGAKYRPGFGAPGNPAQETGLDVEKITVNDAGVTLDKVKGQAWRFEDPQLGLVVDVREMSVPGPLAIPNDGPLTVDFAEINDAFFHISDVTKLGGGGGAGAGAAAGKDWTSYLDILDHLNGWVNAEVHAPLHIVGHGPRQYAKQQDFPLDFSITAGRINYKDLLDSALWARFGAIVGMRVDGDVLALEVLRSNQAEWTPGSDEEMKEMKSGLVRLSRLVRPDPSGKKKDPDSAPIVDPEDIDIKLNDVGLGLTGEIPLDLGALGQITIGKAGSEFAMGGLELKGSTSNRIDWTLQYLNVVINRLNLDGVGTLKTGAISIEDVKDAKMTFGSGMLHPRTLEGTISRATVSKLSFEPAKKKP